nr:EOG090X06CC [Eulimnadia texana]
MSSPSPSQPFGSALYGQPTSLGGSGVLDGSLVPPNLDPSEFPSLSARNFGVTENGGSNALGSRAFISVIGIIKNPSSDAAEFTMSSEDFPALPGTQNDNSSNPGNETKPSTVTSTQNIIPGSISSSGKRGLQISSDGKVTNIPPNMVADQFGMAGLLTFIRVAETDSNLVSLALGSDLTTLGLNLNSPEPLYTNFGGPWADNPCRPQDIDFHVPPEYQINAVIREKLAPLKLSRYQEDLLFYLFYTYVGDVIQIMAATELYNRDWRFHKEERIWITRATGYPMNEKTATFERGTYFCFDPHHWRKMTKELYVEYDKLEERPSGLPANMVLPHGWSSALAEIKPSFVKLICPTAPTIPVTLNSGFRMPAWFDLKGLDLSAPEDMEGINRSTAFVHSLIEEEVKNGIPASRIMIGGFSQGGALSLYSGLRANHKIGGIVALSCWLPLHKSFPDGLNGTNNDTPILMCHGDSDPIVPLKWGLETATFMKKFHKSVDFRTYKHLAHSSSDKEMKDIRDFINQRLPAI